MSKIFRQEQEALVDEYNQLESENVKLREQLAATEHNFQIAVTARNKHYNRAEAAEDRLSGQTCSVPPEFQAELDECKEKLKELSEQEPVAWEIEGEILAAEDDDYPFDVCIKNGCVPLYAKPVPPADVQGKEMVSMTQTIRIAELEHKLAEQQALIRSTEDSLCTLVLCNGTYEQNVRHRLIETLRASNHEELHTLLTKAREEGRNETLQGEKK